MIWVTWRQHRTENILALALLAGFGAVMLLTGLRMASAYSDLGVGACLGTSHGTQHCQDVLTSFNKEIGSVPGLIAWANLLPLIFGVLLAAPLILDLENGTYRLAWTQSVTRMRWTLAKLSLIALGAAVVGVLLVLVFSWWRTPLDRLYGPIQPNVAFDFEGIVPIGYVLFAIALVIAAGTVLRRVIPAIGLSLILFVVVRVGIQTFVRPSLMAPIKSVVPATSDPSGPSSVRPRDWVISSGFSDRLGHVKSDNRVFTMMEDCMSRTGSAAKGSQAMQDAMGACFRSHHVYTYLVYQPASRFWTLQAMEFALYAAVSAILLGLTVWWVRQRIG